MVEVLEVREGIAAAQIEGIAAVIDAQQTLDEVVRWALGQQPPRLIERIVVQDEYTHDVVLRYADGVYLVYDTT